MQGSLGKKGDENVGDFRHIQMVECLRCFNPHYIFKYDLGKVSGQREKATKKQSYRLNEIYSNKLLFLHLKSITVFNLLLSARRWLCRVIKRRREGKMKFLHLSSMGEKIIGIDSKDYSSAVMLSLPP